MLRAQFLCGFRLVDRAGRELRIPVRKAKALFAYLAICSDRLHSREALACLLWDSAGDRAARQSLRKCLSDLRRALGAIADRVLVVDGDRVGIAAGTVETDLAALDRRVAEAELEQAAGLIGTGVFLDGVDVESEPFQDWLRGERLRRNEVAADTLYRLAERQAEDADIGAAIDTAQRALAIDSLHDDAHRLLIGLFARSGCPAAARRQYARYARVVREEFGVEPSPEVMRVVQALDHSVGVSGGDGTLRVAVAGFLDLGVSDEGVAFARGLSEELVTLLAAQRWISVVPANADAQYIVEGTVRSSDNRHRIAIRLLSGADGRSYWSEVLESRATRTFDVQDDLARAAVSRLVTEIERIERRKRTVSPDLESAVDYWHRGNSLFYRYTKESNARARGMLERAIEIDPEFAPAYASLAFVEQFDAFFKYANSPRTRLRRGLEAAQTAVTIDRSDAIGHLALGKVLARMEDFDGATVALETGLSLCPSMEQGEFALGLVHYYQGRQRDALDCFGRATRLNPQSPWGWAVRHMTARCFYDLGRFDHALNWANRAVNTPNAKTIAFILKAAAADRTGNTGLAHRTVDDVVRHDPRMTTDYLVKTFGNEFLADSVESMAERLRDIGLPD